MQSKHTHTRARLAVRVELEAGAARAGVATVGVAAGLGTATVGKQALVDVDAPVLPQVVQEVGQALEAVNTAAVQLVAKAALVLAAGFRCVRCE